MGYYTGSGVTAGGGESVSVLAHFAFYGAHNIYQRATSAVTRKGGVSLADAQAARASCDMQTHKFTWTSGSTSCFYWCANAKGTKRDAAYSQIAGSNLYELTVTDQTLTSKLDSGEWI